MHPRLQTAFDVMYAKAEQFIPTVLRPEATAMIRDGNYGFAAFTAAERLMVTKVTPSNAQAHRTAVAAFGQFWSIFTELSYGAVPSADTCAICGQKKKGAH